MGIFPVFYLVLKNLRCLTALVFLCFFVSCNSEIAKISSIRNTPVRLETVNAGAFTNMMIYATRTDGSFAFARLYTSAPVIEQEMPIGDYRFYGMTFNSVATMTSELCAKSSSYLSGLSNQVTLSFDEATCGDEVFLGNDPSLNLATLPAVTFPFTAIELCDSVEKIASISDECTDNLESAARKQSRGHATGMKATLVTFEKSRGERTVSTGISSGCLTMSPTASSLRGLSSFPLSNFFPEGDGSSTPFLIRIEFYPGDSTCSIGTPHVVDLPNGLAVNNVLAKKISASSIQRKLYFKVGKDEICQGDNLTSTFAGGAGSVSSPNLICNESQFYNIFPGNSDAVEYRNRASKSYKLLSDIDLSDNPVIGNGFNPDWAPCAGVGSNFMPIGVIYYGNNECVRTQLTNIHFDGAGHFIKGLKIVSSTENTGLYSSIYYSTGIESEIKRLTLIDPVITGPSYLGTVVGKSTRIKFKDINIQNAVLDNPTSDFVGGLSGLSQGDTVNLVTVSNISLDAQNQIGGIFGQSNTSTITTNIFDSYVSGVISAGNYVGGIVGNMGSNNSAASFTISNLKRSRFIGTINSGQYSGGLLGQGVTTRISNSYAEATFKNTATGSVRFGGIVGNMLSNKDTSEAAGVFNSYIIGSLTHSCANEIATSCMMGTVIGDHDQTFTTSNFNTTVYRNSDEINSTLIGSRGTAQSDASFMLASPGWTIATTNDWLTYFPSAIWKFSNTDYPRLVGEPVED